MVLHEELVRTIIEAVKNSGVKLEVLNHKYQYKIYGSYYYIDILIQIGSVVHIFECKIKSKEKKAKKQLAFHKWVLENNKKYFYYKGQLFPYSKVKVYYVCEEENIIIEIATKEEETLSPNFLDNPKILLNK